jgi:peptidyl-prolyl cis-trans isomerase C
MRFFRILSLSAAALCLGAQTPSNTPPKPPAPATPANPTYTTLTGPDGVAVPIPVIPQAPVIPPDRVVFQVGDIKLTSGQVGQILDAYPENQRIFANGPGRTQFIDNVVRVLLMSQEGRRRKLDETEAYKNQIMYTSATVLAARADEDFRSRFHPDEPSLRAYYEAHKSEYLQFHVYHILIRGMGPAPLAPGQKGLTDAEALAKALEIRQKLLQGADFGDLARAESYDTGSKAKGGDLGLLKRGQSVPTFEDAAFALPVGELSQPVKTIYGYHLIKVTEIKPTRTYEELRPEFEKTLENEASRKFLADLKAKNKIYVDPDFATLPKPADIPKP